MGGAAEKKAKMEEIRRSREAQIEALRTKVEAKHNDDRKKLVNKANQLTAEKQRLKAEDDVRAPPPCPLSPLAPPWIHSSLIPFESSPLELRRHSSPRRGGCG